MRGRQLDCKVSTAEENAKRQFNKRVFKTFFIIILSFGIVDIIVIIQYCWQVLVGDVTLGMYIVQSLIGRTIANSLTITNPIIILRNKDVRDAWKELRK